MHGFAIHAHLAFEIGVDSGNDFHGGGFASTVFPDKTMDLASIQREVDVFQGGNTTEGF